MNEWVKILVASSVLSSVLAGVIGWFAASYKIEQELHTRQAEAGYEALIKANVLLRQSETLAVEAERDKDGALAAIVKKLRRESDASYGVAQHKIAAYGDESVVRAMSDYYSKYKDAAKPCINKEKFRSDAQIYMAIRKTLGVGGSVTHEHLANLMFICSLK